MVADIKKARWYLDRYLTLLEDAAFDKAASDAERRLCERMDDAFNRVDHALTDFVVSAECVELVLPLPEVTASFDCDANGAVAEVLR